jgi:hypothetical protein
MGIKHPNLWGAGKLEASVSNGPFTFKVYVKGHLGCMIIIVKAQCGLIRLWSRGWLLVTNVKEGKGNMLA